MFRLAFKVSDHLSHLPNTRPVALVSLNRRLKGLWPLITVINERLPMWLLPQSLFLFVCLSTTGRGQKLTFSAECSVASPLGAGASRSSWKALHDRRPIRLPHQPSHPFRQLRLPACLSGGETETFPVSHLRKDQLLRTQRRPGASERRDHVGPCGWNQMLGGSTGSCGGCCG